MSTDYRALCAELHAALEKRCETLEEDRLLDRSAAALRAALAQLKPVEPTDEDLEDLAEVMNVSGNPVPAMRRALELWGRQ